MKLYHISRDVRRPRFRMKPRVPENGMLGEDSTIPRICVAPTIAGCLRGMRGLDNGEIGRVRYKHVSTNDYPNRYGVYMVDADPVEPFGVPDSHRTGELWLCKATTFDLLGEIDTAWYPAGQRQVNFAWKWAVRL